MFGCILTKYSHKTAGKGLEQRAGENGLRQDFFLYQKNDFSDQGKNLVLDHFFSCPCPNQVCWNVTVYEGGRGATDWFWSLDDILSDTWKAGETEYCSPKRLVSKRRTKWGIDFLSQKIWDLLIKKSWGWDFEIMLLIKLVEHAQLCIQIFNSIWCFIVKKTRKLK